MDSIFISSELSIDHYISVFCYQVAVIFWNSRKYNWRICKLHVYPRMLWIQYIYLHGLENGRGTRQDTVYDLMHIVREILKDGKLKSCIIQNYQPLHSWPLFINQMTFQHVLWGVALRPPYFRSILCVFFGAF